MLDPKAMIKKLLFLVLCVTAMQGTLAQETASAHEEALQKLFAYRRYVADCIRTETK